MSPPFATYPELRQHNLRQLSCGAPDSFPRCTGKVLRHCLYEDGKTVELHAVVVMPNHVHLLLTPLLDNTGAPFSLQMIMQRIKSVSAHTVNRLLDSSGPVWQEESFDTIVRSDAEYQQKLEYIEQNPARAGLIQSGESYRWFWKKV